MFSLANMFTDSFRGGALYNFPCLCWHVDWWYLYTGSCIESVLLNFYGFSIPIIYRRYKLAAGVQGFGPYNLFVPLLGCSLNLRYMVML